MKIVYSPEHLRHATTLAMAGCPTPYLEVPARANAILRAVEEACLGEVIEPQDFGIELLEAVHTSDFVAYLRSAYRASRPFYEGCSPAVPDTYAARGWRHKPSGWPGRIGYFAFDATSPLLDGTWEAAYQSAQCAATAADLVRTGLPAAYALCRPPGHHAASDQHGGFCYLNNAAIAAAAMRRWTGERVAILDIDYHHGNGTQEIFYRDPDVLFCSLHVDPDLDFPFFWGGRDERGEGAGLGANHNWPLPFGISEMDYLVALTEAAAVIRQFRPGYLVVSAGFDFLDSDPVAVAGGGFRIGLAGVSSVARAVADLALPTVIVQEGGYDVQRLGACVVRFLGEFGR